MSALTEKGGGGFAGIKLLLCENPLPPLAEAVAAAQAKAPRSNYYTEAYSAPLRRLIAECLGVPERLVHVNAGSELILRQLFARFVQRVHLLTPTFALFPDIARAYSETRLSPAQDFGFDLGRLEAPPATTLVSLVNPINPNGRSIDMAPLPALLTRHPDTQFLVDEALIGLAGRSVARGVPRYPSLLVTRTVSKAHCLAGFRVGFAVLPEHVANDLNRHNDAYPLAWPSQAAAIATLEHEDKIHARAARLLAWTEDLAAQLRALGVHCFPSETYFVLADCAPHDAATLAERLLERNILVKPLGDAHLGAGYMARDDGAARGQRAFPRRAAGASVSAHPASGPFARHHRRYDAWFERHEAAYLSELLAVRALLPWRERGLEIGVSTGRFAAPLGVGFGIDPAHKVLGYASGRGVRVAATVAEALPFANATFDYALVVTTICFVDDPAAVLREAARVLRLAGELVIAFIDGLGQDYRAHQAENVLYCAAKFHYAAEVSTLLAQAAFRDAAWLQTLSAPVAGMRAIKPTAEGRGRGAFLVVRTRCGSRRPQPGARRPVTLLELPPRARAVVRNLTGGAVFGGRLAAMSLIAASPLEVLQNRSRRGRVRPDTRHADRARARAGRSASQPAGPTGVASP